MFASQADWTTLLSCVTMNVLDTELEKVDINANLNRLQTVLEQFKLMPISNPRYTVHQSTLLAILYISSRQVPAAKMLETLCRRAEVQDTDIELRCMQAVTAMYDAVIREDVQDHAYILACKLVEVDLCVTEAIVRVLASHSEEREMEIAQHICSQRVCV